MVATFGDAAQIGLEIERSDDRRVMVMTPISPNPWSGLVRFITPQHVARLDLATAACVENVERFGQETNELLRKPV